MTRTVWPMVGIVLVVVVGSATALDVVSDPIAVWDDDVYNRVTDVVYNPQHDEYLILFQGRQQYFHRFSWEPVNGFMQLPTDPGLGIDFDESKIEERRELRWD